MLRVGVRELTFSATGSISTNVMSERNTCPLQQTSTMPEVAGEAGTDTSLGWATPVQRCMHAAKHPVVAADSESSVTISPRVPMHTISQPSAEKRAECTSRGGLDDVPKSRSVCSTIAASSEALEAASSRLPPSASAEQSRLQC